MADIHNKEESRGFVVVTSYTADRSIPIPNVSIVLTRTDTVAKGEEPYTVNFTTGENGRSEKIAVPCPSKEYSLDKNNFSVLPYATYNLYANVDGFAPIIIEGIQVFEQQVSIQDLSLIPANDVARTPPQKFIIPVHSLFGDVGGSGQAPANQNQTGRVLVEPIIPDRITIHLGRPTVSATDVSISFQDYIKNVASSEVYPTWPEEALRANIHAQISLALNRVFTEWYKSKGFSFQITNSTAFDQYYVHGRNIFEVMSRITDEIFNTYVRRPGTVEPYYTEYCDGKTVTCKGMKQWGTVSKAEEGMNALAILQHYYGNIEMVRCQNIGAIPQSYSGTALRIGSKGEAVKVIQRQLNRIANDYPFLGKLKVNGEFQRDTENVVKKFQKQFSLLEDGIVGESTWYKISYIYVAVKKLAELTSEGELSNGELVAGVYPGTAFKVGSTGPHVEEIQFWLNQVGQYVTTIPVLGEDGIFGDETRRAVIAFQDYYNLTADGIVEEVTWNKLYAEYCSIESDVDNGGNSPGIYPGDLLMQGDKNEYVKRIQFYLNIIGRYQPFIPRLSTDGIFENDTLLAVQSFQEYYGLPKDGIVGRMTWNKIYEVYTGLTGDIIPSEQRPGAYPGIVLKEGSSGNSVKELQYYLYLLSAYYQTIPIISYDGIFGQRTKEAVAAYQKLKELIVDGVVGRITWSSIYSNYEQLHNFDGPALAYRILPYPEMDLSVGAIGEEVGYIQYLLSYLGMYYEEILPCTSSNLFDKLTEESVKSFQIMTGLLETGSMNHITWNTLVETWIGLLIETGDQKVTEGEYPGFVMKVGSIGVEVVELQRYVNEIIERYQNDYCLTVNGVFNPQTEEAVIRIQKELGIMPSGIVDRYTWNSIYNASCYENM